EVYSIVSQRADGAAFGRPRTSARVPSVAGRTRERDNRRPAESSRDTMAEDDRNKVDPRRWSRLVVDGAKQAPSRAMLRAVGFRDDDFNKPQVGIASTWSMVTPCNMHIDGLAREAAVGADQ